MTSVIRVVAAILLTITLSSCSESQPVKAFVKGSFAQIQEAYKNTPHMIVFWSQDCAYCMKELALFQNARPRGSKVKLITVSTEPFLSAKIIRKLHQDNNLHDAEAWVFSESVREKLYFDVDKSWRGELPLTFFVGKDKNMVKQMGILTETELINWLQLQS